MNHSGDAAEQIVRMSFEGVEVAARITGTAAKEIALLLIAALKNDKGNLKLKGKARLTSMLKSGKPLEIFSVRESDLQKFMQGAKQYGIVYCVLRNTKNSPDGLCDVMVKADDAPKISRLVERFQFATVDKARIESEILAEKAARAEDAPEQDAEITPDAEPEAPDINDTDKLLDDLMGPDEGKAEPDTPELIVREPVTAAELVTDSKEAADSPPFSASDPPPPLSEPISANEKKPENPISSKPSVKQMLREMVASRKAKEAAAAGGHPYSRLRHLEGARRL
jgi:hypothetical protein